MPETQGVAAKPHQKTNTESYRDGGDIQTRDSGEDTGKRENNDEAYRDGGDLQSRGPNTATSEAQTTSSQDDVERGA